MEKQAVTESSSLISSIFFTTITTFWESISDYTFPIDAVLEKQTIFMISEALCGSELGKRLRRSFQILSLQSLRWGAHSSSSSVVTSADMDSAKQVCLEAASRHPTLFAVLCPTSNYAKILAMQGSSTDRPLSILRFVKYANTAIDCEMGETLCSSWVSQNRWRFSTKSSMFEVLNKTLSASLEVIKNKEKELFALLCQSHNFDEVISYPGLRVGEGDNC